MPPPQTKPLAWSAIHFTLAAHRLDQLPPDLGAEIAFAGRSNAGKSSALNAITGQHKLARISKTPGRTQQLIVFSFNPLQRFIDLPGYGYAEVPVELRQHWGKLLDRYFAERASLRGLFLFMDIRHPLRDGDRQLLELCAARGLPCHILLSKADKLSRSQALRALAQVRDALREHGDGFSLQLFSAPLKTGVAEARTRIGAWLAPPTPSDDPSQP